MTRTETDVQVERGGLDGVGALLPVTGADVAGALDVAGADVGAVGVEVSLGVGAGVDTATGDALGCS